MQPAYETNLSSGWCLYKPSQTKGIQPLWRILLNHQRIQKYHPRIDLYLLNFPGHPPFQKAIRMTTNIGEWSITLLYWFKKPLIVFFIIIELDECHSRAGWWPNHLSQYLLFDFLFIQHICDNCVPQQTQDLHLQDDKITPVRWTRVYKWCWPTSKWTQGVITTKYFILLLSVTL